MNENIIAAVISAIAAISVALISRPRHGGGTVDVFAAGRQRKWYSIFAGISTFAFFISIALLLLRWMHPIGDVPIGTVIAYWGNIQPTPPDGYELCDGDVVHTPGSPINGQRKPKLFDTFLMGASAGTANVTKSEPEGKNTHSFEHTHDAGELWAQIGMENNPEHPSGFMHLAAKGPAFTSTDEFSVNDPRKPNGRVGFGTAVAGSTGGVINHVLTDVDIRPLHLSVLYLIRVK